MEILFCDECRRRINPGEIEAGRAVEQGENVYCSECAKKLGVSAAPARPSPPAFKRPGATRKMRKPSTQTAAPRGTRSVPAAARSSATPAIVAILAALVGFGLAAWVLSSGGGPGDDAREADRPAPPRATQEEQGRGEEEAPKQEPEEAPSTPRSLFGSLRPGGLKHEKTPKEIFEETKPRTSPPREVASDEKSFGPVAAPPGYFMPADPVYRQDFEKGVGPWVRARLVQGGLGSSKQCARNPGGGTSEHYGFKYTMTAKTVVRAAVYVLGEGAPDIVYFLGQDQETNKNWHATFKGLERGKWHVLSAPMKEWSLWGKRASVEGRGLKTIVIHSESNSAFVFDDVVIYEEGAKAAGEFGPAPAPPGYAMPAKAVFRCDFETGRAGEFEDVEVVKGGLGASRWCGRTTADRSSEHEGLSFRMTAATVVRCAVYLPPEHGGGTGKVRLLLWDKALAKNVQTDFKGLAPGRWHVLHARMKDWEAAGAIEGQEFTVFKIYAGKGRTVVFDDVVIYEEGAKAASEFGPSPAPPGYAMPKRALYRMDFEAGAGAWQHVEIVPGGLGSSTRCARLGQAESAEHWGANVTMTERSVLRFACYIPAKGGPEQLGVFAWSEKSKGNYAAYFPGLAPGRWHVLEVRMKDWAKGSNREKPVGHLFKSIVISPGKGKTVVFDDVVIYEE